MATLAYHIFKQQVSYDGGLTWVDVEPYTTIKMPVDGLTCEAPWSARVVAVQRERKLDDPCDGSEITSGCSKPYYETPTEYYINLCDSTIVNSKDTEEINSLFTRANQDSSYSTRLFCLSRLILTDKVKTIGNGAFNSRYISEIVFSGTPQLETIEDYGFYFYDIGGARQIVPNHGSGNKRVFNMPDSLKNIGKRAFKFVSLYGSDDFLPDTYIFGSNSLISSIDDSAFAAQNGAIIYFNMPTPPSNISSTIFSDSDESYGIIIVPSQYLSSYRSALPDLSPVICSKGALGNTAKAEYSSYEGLVTIPCDSTGAFSLSTDIGNWLRIGDCVDTISGDLGNKKLLYLNLGNSVKHIGDGAFSGQIRLQEITLPESLLTIGNSAFTGNELIEEIIIPSGVTSIGDYAFQNCNSLKRITIKGGDIGERAFSFNFNNSYLYDSITISEGVTSIGSSAFTNVGLDFTDLILPDSVTSIGDYAFNTLDVTKCTRLTGITIGSGITSIGVGISGVLAVTNSSNLETVNGNFRPYGDETTFELPNVKYLNCSLDSGFTSIHIGTEIETIANLSGSFTSMTIDSTSPSSINIYWGAMKGNYLIYVPCGSYNDYMRSWSDHAASILPKPECPPLPTKMYYLTDSGLPVQKPCNGNPTITSQENIGLYGMNPIVLEIGDCVTSIGDDAFWNCSSLTSITIPNSVTSIGNSAFEDCSSLTSVEIPNSVTSIGTSAFRNCARLESVNIPSGVTEIKEYTFRTTNLTSITIPSSVTIIDDYAFQYCSSLESITVEATDPPYLGYSVFQYISERYKIYVPCEYVDIYKSTGKWSYHASHIYGIPPCIKPIKLYAIYSDSSTYSLDCNSSTEITRASTNPAGYQFTAMTSADIGDCVTSIGNEAFQNCYGLTSATIGSSVTSIGGSAFSGCTNLTSITIPDSVTSIGTSAFTYCGSLTSATIGSGVTSIGDYAFEHCSGLTNITIPNSVTSIGSYAFDNCYGLTSTTIGSGVTSINGSAFSRCSSLTNITIPNSVTSIGNGAFSSCTRLTSITIPSGVTSIGNSAFTNCYGLTNITIPSGVTSIGNYVFYSCSGLTSIDIPNSVTSIGRSAFNGCKSLTSVEIPASVGYIGFFAFYSCSGLTSITCLATTPPSLATEALEKTNNCAIYVPAQSVDAYKSASGWRTYASRIQAIP